MKVTAAQPFQVVDDEELSLKAGAAVLLMAATAVCAALLATGLSERP